MITFTSVDMDEEHHDGHHDRSSPFRSFPTSRKIAIALDLFGRLIGSSSRSPSRTIWTSRMLNTLEWIVHRLHVGSSRYAFINRDFISQDFTHRLQDNDNIFKRHFYDDTLITKSTAMRQKTLAPN